MTAERYLVRARVGEREIDSRHGTFNQAIHTAFALRELTRCSSVIVVDTVNVSENGSMQVDYFWDRLEGRRAASVRKVGVT